MWQRKYFKTYKAMMEFVDKNHGKIQWQQIFVNNEYAIEYRKLRRIY